MKTIHQINFWTCIINVFLFIVPYLGLLFMTVLGAIQLLLAMAVVFCYYRGLDKKMCNMIIGYWVFVAIDFSGLALAYGHDSFSNDLFCIPLLFLFPAAIAIYFVYTTYTITKNLSHEHAATQH